MFTFTVRSDWLAQLGFFIKKPKTLPGSGYRDIEMPKFRGKDTIVVVVIIVVIVVIVDVVVFVVFVVVVVVVVITIVVVFVIVVIVVIIVLLLLQSREDYSPLNMMCYTRNPNKIQ